MMRCYKVVLLAPEDMQGIEIGEEFLDNALQELNKHKVPGRIRFDDRVVADLHVEHDPEQVIRSLENHNNVAMVIAAGIDSTDMDRLRSACAQRGTSLIVARDPLPDEMKTTEQQASELGDDPDKLSLEELLAISTRVSLSSLTDPISSSEEVNKDRFRRLAVVLVRGVMRMDQKKQQERQ